MTLEEQISQITDPHEFTRLCNTILTEKYGYEFQIIDGTRSDEGNDGYITSEKRIIAMYCPIKPERKKDADYFNKIRDDMLKAVKLRDSGKFNIEHWTFITPRKLSNDVIVKMRQLAETNSLNAVHLESTYLATELKKHKQLIDEFPNLHVVDISSQLDCIIEELKSKQGALKEKSTDTTIDDEHIYRKETQNNEELDRLLRLRKEPRKDDTKSNIKIILYKTKDPVVKLNAILGLIDYYDPMEDSADEMIALCDNGISISESLSDPSAKSYFLAHKGYMISYKYSELDIQSTFQIMTGNVLGFQTITDKYKKKVIERLHELEKGYKRAFSEALDLAENNNNYYALASVLLSIGTAASQRAVYLQKLNVADRAETEKAISKKAILTAKDIYDAYDDEYSSANATYNLANNIRLFGEVKEAMELLKDVQIIAEKYEDHLLKQKIKWLLHTLETGEVPDYVGGERRDWD